MRRLSESYRSIPVGIRCFWQEDICELRDLLAAITNEPVKITADGFEYDSLDELFSNAGPRIKGLRLNAEHGRNEHSSILFETNGKGGEFTVFGRGRLEDACGKLQRFLSQRGSSFEAYLSYFRIEITSILVGSIILMLYKMAPIPISYRLWLGYPAVWLILGGIIFAPLRFLFWRGAPLIKNFSRREALFSRRAQILRYAEWLTAAVIGCGLTLLFQFIGKAVGQ